MNTFGRGEPVAVMQAGSNSPFESMSIATVGNVDGDRVKLLDGREYQQSGNEWVSEDRRTYIKPATRWHISVVHKRCLQPYPRQARSNAS